MCWKPWSKIHRLQSRIHPGRERLVDHLPQGAWHFRFCGLWKDLGSKHTAVLFFFLMCFVLGCLTLMTCVSKTVFLLIDSCNKRWKKKHHNYPWTKVSKRHSGWALKKKHRPQRTASPQCFFHQSQYPLTPLLTGRLSTDHVVSPLVNVNCWGLQKPHGNFLLNLWREWKDTKNTWFFFHSQGTKNLTVDSTQLL